MEHKTCLVMKKVICPPCGAVFVTHSDDELIAIVQAHALTHGHPVTREDVLRSAQPLQLEIPRNSFRLTAREAEVLYWVVLGKTNPEIGAILDIRPRTVSKHVERIFAKLNVENRTAAAALLLRAESLE